MRCINCGAPLDDDKGVFCEKCYKEVVNSDSDASAPEENNGNNTTQNRGFEKKPKNKKSTKKKATRIILGIIAGILAVVLLIVIGGFSWIMSLLNGVEKGTLSSDLGIVETEDAPFDEDVKNIALYGLDTRSNDSNGRSDAIIVLSIDRINKQIKMTSIARDTYIRFESGKRDKITHAWAYGKASLAVKTLNSNFNLDITDYVSMNFYQFSEVIDYIGGVMIDVDSAEMRVMNKEYIPYLKEMGIECDYIKETGYQLLNGGQALAYTRDRYTGSDMARGGRQREVLGAMFDKVKTMSPLKFPKLVEMILDECTTSLESKEMLSIGMWALTASPELKSLGLPNEECNAHGQMINGTSYMVYDLEVATDILHKFIYSAGDEAVSSSSSSDVSSNVSSKK